MNTIVSAYVQPELTVVCRFQDDGEFLDSSMVAVHWLNRGRDEIDGQQQHNGQWPGLPVGSSDDWDLLTALVVTEESLPPSKRPFSNYLAHRIVAQAKNAKAPIKAAIRCVMQERWASESMSMLGWQVINGKKVAGFKAFTDLRPFIIATINEVSLLCVYLFCNYIFHYMIAFLIYDDKGSLQVLHLRY